MTSAAPLAATRRGLLAQSLQELLTVIVRLRNSPPSGSTNVEEFRRNLHEQVASATKVGRQLGYAEEDVAYATYAVVAFLDETVHGVPNASFAPWRGRPMQEELFGINVGGDVFFDYLDALLPRENTEDLADVLEVYQLCLLLGFKGRYGAAGLNELHGWITRLRDRMEQVRGPAAPLAPQWAPPHAEHVEVSGDPWQRRLRLAVLGTLGVTLLLFLVYSLVLGSRVGALVAAGR